jgi:CTP synthase
MQEEGLDKVTLQKLALPDTSQPNLAQWRQFLEKHKNPQHEVTIGLIGKYVELQDSYKSILESFIHAGAVNEVRVNVRSIHSEHINRNKMDQAMKGLDGILVAPGFGERGIEGKVRAVQYARENGIPFLGICLGMQMAVIEYARNVLGLTDANSTEMNPSTADPVISLMEEQKSVTNKGGTMRLGAWDCTLKKGSLVQKVYGGAKLISERHRHRYEFNNEYKKDLEAAGLVTSGANRETGLVEIVELPKHPWFIGVQYHPEYKSTVANPHPLFVGFVEASLQHKKKQSSASLA